MISLPVITADPATLASARYLLIDLTVPPDEYAPLPTLPNNVSVVDDDTDATSNVPFAAVLPPTPATTTTWPATRPCAEAVVSSIGLALVAPLMPPPRLAPAAALRSTSAIV